MSLDVIIPVYKSPEWVKLCVYALFKNTDAKTLRTVFLINDCDDSLTKNCLKNLARKYPKIQLLENEKNLGFIKTVNRGLAESKADYILLLNTDCLISKHTAEKLIAHMKRDPKIGLICPISSNAANLTLDMFEGFTYSEMNILLEKKFSGKTFNACTVVGNCLLMSKKCVDQLGGFDEAYGLGYGDETDYQFKAMAAGFSAKVAIDTYVFHQSEASFGKSAKKQARQKKNHDLFMSRWGEEYRRELKKYEQHDPIEYIKAHLSPEDMRPRLDAVFYLDGIAQDAGGVHVVIDIANYLAINGFPINVAYNSMSSYDEPMAFCPVKVNNLIKYSPKKIISTIWATAFQADKIARETKSEVVSLIQGYESYFENGSVYGAVETSYKLADELIAISKYLQKELLETFRQKSYLIKNGLNLDLIAAQNSRKKAVTLTVSLRGLPMKGDWVILDLIKRIDNSLEGITVNIVYQSKYAIFPELNNPANTYNKILGPISRTRMYEILQSSDLYIDASQSEGFGLTALEAMAAGCVPIASDSKGVRDYLQNGQNGILIDKINDTDAYFAAVSSLCENEATFARLKASAAETASKFDFDQTIEDYLKVLSRPAKPHKVAALSKYEQKIISELTKKDVKTKHRTTFLKVGKVLLPRPIKAKIMKLANYLHYYYES